VERGGGPEESGGAAVKELTHALRTHGSDARSRETTDVLLADLLRSPGVPLDTATRAFFEPRFGHDLSRVRVHSDGASAETAAQLGARAFTVGHHVILGSHDRGLLAHELAHVVQQRHATARPGDRVEIGRPGDAFEQDADAAAGAVMSDRPAPPPLQASTPRLQGSWLSTLLDFTIFLPIGIYRLLGGEYYWASTLKDYMKRLEKNQETEGEYDSDNKARACVKREKELGPSYSIDVRVLLIWEMLAGWTSDSDEKAIITLLRNHRNDIPDVVKRIGRPRIWSDFSGDNLAVVKALTMTKDDAGDALVDELRKKDDDQIRLFQRNTTVPELQEAARKALALKRMTMPVPSRATVDPQGVATFVINGINIIVRPDEYDPALGQGGFTNVEFLRNVQVLQAPPGVDPTTMQAGAFRPPTVTITFTTRYPSEEARTKPSGYGRGTVTGDTNTLQFHELQHNKDWLDYLTTHRPPQFGGRATMNFVEYQAEVDKWNQETDQYHQNGVKNTVGKTDCVGTLATDDQLQVTGLTCETALENRP
jgi:hypothetical protein